MGADCKSVGLAYPGSNPGAATRVEPPFICGNAADGGSFASPEALLCVGRIVGGPRSFTGGEVDI